MLSASLKSNQMEKVWILYAVVFWMIIPSSIVIYSVILEVYFLGFLDI